MSDIISFINSCGFPVFVTVFLLYQQTKINDIISENTNAITKLSERIEVLSNERDNQAGAHE